MSDSDIIVLGEGRALSRRKAKKLAYHYRGSSRGHRYADFLSGKQGGFYVRNNRLCRLSKAGRVTIMSVHSEDAAHGIRNAMESITTYSIESPHEVTIKD